LHFVKHEMIFKKCILAAAFLFNTSAENVSLGILLTMLFTSYAVRR